MDNCTNDSFITNIFYKIYHIDTSNKYLDYDIHTIGRLGYYNPLVLFLKDK